MGDKMPKQNEVAKDEGYISLSEFCEQISGTESKVKKIDKVRAFLVVCGFLQRYLDPFTDCIMYRETENGLDSGVKCKQKNQYGRLITATFISGRSLEICKLKFTKKDNGNTKSTGSSLLNTVIPGVKPIVQKSVYSDEKSRLNSYDRLLEILKNKGNFEGLCHYTDLSNLNYIFDSGFLFSRNQLSSDKFTDAAEPAVLEHTKNDIKCYARFFYKEKTPTIYRNEGIKADNSKPHMPIPVLLIFDEQLLRQPNVRFLDGGGGSSYSKMTDSLVEACKFNWDAIFYRGPVPSANCDIEEVFGVRDRHLIINHKNAEFLFPKQVSTEYVMKIYFRSRADYKHFRVTNNASYRFKVEIRPDKFFCHSNCDYLDDFSVLVNSVSAQIVIERKNGLVGYRQMLTILNKFGNRFEFDVNRLKYYSQVKIYPSSRDKRVDKFDIDLRNIGTIRLIEYSINGFSTILWRDEKC